ncbi:cellulose biosynthesis cyclic di-GMP-binding regulatory protein BcsB [Oceaniglobus roseus]|uniref:cellulose biosynthesis cyclic di-GMP-binding regulatory protein BcsB n=1 Tax=Oceaniglobus roseus TaxID=1737570 RepID=UPI000C7F5475|nr:cellulose biosynthesis cyclic di-GMP-binding regulatory protein BcsB [Kandeliimicrobium roseum]
MAAFGLGLAVASPAFSQATETPPPSDQDVPIINLDPLLQTLPGDAPPATAEGDGPVTIPEYSRTSESADPLPARPDSFLTGLKSERNDPNRILRLSGERQSATLFVDVPAPADVIAFVLSYRVSINVLPSRSELLVTVNGTEAPPITLSPEDGFVAAELPVELLREGHNRIEITARQAHRIFCGPDATFAIWTEIDLGQSGVRIPSADIPMDEAGFATALNGQLATQGNVPIRMDPDASSDLLHDIAVRVSGLSGGSAVDLKLESPYDVGGAAPPLARIAILETAPATTGVRRGADGAAVLVLGGPQDGMRAELDAILPPPEPLQDIASLVPGVTTSLADLGFTDTTTFNRYAEQRLVFRLPDDWLMLSNAEALLRLTYGFAEGLPQGALMLVKLNGTTVRLLPLDSGGGQVLEPLDIGFKANLLNPGPNALEFVTIVPGDPPDQPCPQIAGPLLTIVDDSTLLVPPTPRMSFIGLRSALTSLGPDQVVPVTPEARSPWLERLDLAIQSTLRPISGRESNAGARLNVVGADNLGAFSFGTLDLSRNDLEGLFYDRGPEVLQEPVEDPSGGPRYARRVQSMVAGFARQIGQLAKPGDGPLKTWIAGRKAQAALLMPDPEHPETLWLIASPGVDPALLAGDLAAARVSPDGPRGRVSILTAAGQWQNWQDASMMPVLKEPLTFRNFRNVAGNYASWSPLYFVSVLFGLTLLSVVLALIFVVSTRGRRKR